VLNPRLDPADVEKEKKVVLDEIHTYEDTPDERIHDLFADVVWAGHPLGTASSEPGVGGGLHAGGGPGLPRATLWNLQPPDRDRGKVRLDRFLAQVSLRFGRVAPGIPPSPTASSRTGATSCTT